MKQPAPIPCRTIQIVTLIYFLLVAGLLVAGFFQPALLIAGTGLMLLGAYCYFFWSPVAYELSNDTLTVFFRASRKVFPAVTSCALVRDPFPVFGTLRLCGNGGIFAGSGIFWNKQLGIFRAYLTRSKPAEWVLVQTRTQKIVISPTDPTAFVEFASQLS